METVPTSLARPTDATLSVTKAARLLGVHPNTVRAWSDAGRLRYYRINPRGDRRYRLGDLQRFLAAAETSPTTPDGLSGSTANGQRRSGRVPSGRDARPREAVRDADEPVAAGFAVRILARLASLDPTNGDLDQVLTAAARHLCEGRDLRTVAVLELRGERLMTRAAAGSFPGGDRSAGFGLLGRTLSGRGSVIASADTDPGWMPIASGVGSELAATIPGPAGTNWGVLYLGAESRSAFGEDDLALVEAAATQVGAFIRAARIRDDLGRQVHRAEALRRMTHDIGARLDLGEVVAGLVDHALVLFGADRAAVFLRQPDGNFRPAASRGLSSEYLAVVRQYPEPSLPSAAILARKPLFAVDYADDERAAAIRAAIVQEGYDTLCVAPLLDGNELLGWLTVYHDEPRPWTGEDLDTISAFAAQGTVAIKTAGNYSQMATWAAQLQSIQDLGARLSRLTSVHEIGLAIATELRQLIDYHNVRVYRQYGDELVPVAMQGQVGEYVDETPDQLRVHVGEGITGWVAEHKVAQNLADAAKDARASTIAGTEEDMDESMLLAPMLMEEQVIGVLVLSKLGLHQFSEDDLRLLVIYASFAAQAMANADATERLRDQSATLERQLRGQRELLQITESILTTLDPRAVLEQIADRLSALIASDNVAIEIVGSRGLLEPLTARGIHADLYMQPWEPGETGIATWVLEHNEPQLVVDERNDPRVNHIGMDEIVDGSLIVVPLRGRAGAVGVLTLERLGTTHAFTEDEYDLVQLFAAQVSIALQNAEIHSAVEVRARTDNLTGLLNHGTFQEWLARSVGARDGFSLLMLDLDGFKGVNDALGHQAGDRFLREVATAIVAAGRDTDHVFRYGGDEFAMLLPGTDAHNALRVAERVQAAVRNIAEPGSVWASEDIDASASIGISTYPTDGLIPAQILLAADRACFVAKRRGRNQIATAAEGEALAAEFSLQEPTPVDPPSVGLA